MRVALLLTLCPLVYAAFRGPVTIQTSRTNGWPRAVISADFNRDNIPDVVVANLPSPGSSNPERGSIAILLGSRTSTFAAFTELPASGHPSEMVAADYNRDGFLDLGVVIGILGSSGNEFCVYPGNGAGGFGSAQCSAIALIAGLPTVADINRDSILDVILVRGIDHTMPTLLGNGNGTFRAGAVISASSPAFTAAADWTGDGVTDLVYYSNAGTLNLARGTGSGTFINLAVASAPPGAVIPASADLNRDGRPEIIVPHPSGGLVSVYRVTNSGFEAPVNVSVPLLVTPTAAIRTFDVDRDGDLDVLFNPNAGQIKLLRNDGAGNLTVESGTFMPNANEFALGDFNADGLLDVARVFFGPNAPSFVVDFGAPVISSMTLDPPALSGTYGQSLRLTARLLATESADPGGLRVQLLNNAAEVGSSTWTRTAPPASPPPFSSFEIGNAELRATLPVGTHTLSAFFPGNSLIAASTSPSVTVRVTPASSTVRLLADAYTIRRDEPEPFDVAIESGTTPINEGVARFVADGQIVAAAVVSGGVARFRLTRNSLPLGQLKGTVVYENPNYLTSSSGELTLLIQSPFTLVSAAYPQPPVARDGIATLAIPGLTVEAAQTPGVPWPTKLSGVEVEIDGQNAPLAYAGPNQVNFLIPATVPEGTRTLRVRVNGVVVSQGTANVRSVAPGIFTANGTGAGVPAALAALYASSGTESVPVFDCASGSCLPAPMPLGSGDQVLVLSLYMTGLRNNTGNVQAFVGGTRAEVLFAGPHLTIPGLDQVNVKFDRSFFRPGEFDLMLTVDGQPANTVRVAFR